MNIAIDLDSVLNNLLEVWIADYNRLYNDTLEPADIKTWDTHLYVKPDCGTRIYQMLTPDLIDRTMPQPGAVEATQELAKRHTLMVVSAISRGTFDAKRSWLRKYFPHIPHFIATHSKALVRCDVLIDDALHNLEDAAAAGIRPICFTQPYNRAWQGERLNSWADALEVL